MEKIDILLWIVSGGFTIMFGLIVVMWNRFDKIDDEIKGIRTELHSIDKRLYGVEILLHAQECCVMKDDKAMKKAEGE